MKVEKIPGQYDIWLIENEDGSYIATDKKVSEDDE